MSAAVGIKENQKFEKVECDSRYMRGPLASGSASLQRIPEATCSTRLAMRAGAGCALWALQTSANNPSVTTEDCTRNLCLSLFGWMLPWQRPEPDLLRRPLRLFFSYFFSTASNLFALSSAAFSRWKAMTAADSAGAQLGCARPSGSLMPRTGQPQARSWLGSFSADSHTVNTWHSNAC